MEYFRKRFFPYRADVRRAFPAQTFAGAYTPGGVESHLVGGLDRLPECHGRLVRDVCRECASIIDFWLKLAIVVSVGLFGAACGFKIFRVGRVKSPIAQSQSMGTDSHAVGMSRAMGYGHVYGAYASLGLILNGLLTALFAPLLSHLLGVA